MLCKVRFLYNLDTIIFYYFESYFILNYAIFILVTVSVISQSLFLVVYIYILHLFLFQLNYFSITFN